MPAHPGEGAVPPPCQSDDLAVVVRWQRDGTGLRGQVIAENVGNHACQLGGKPSVTPLRADGSPLPVETVITLELRSPLILQPGERAAASVSWSCWCGHQASDQARVEWTGGSAIANVAGPAQPDCVSGRADNLTSYRFNLIK